MSFQRHNSKYTESRININNEDELPLPYSRLMQLGLLYTPKYDSLLMIGLGAGSITNYLSKYLPNAYIEGVELDKEVVRLAKKYFHLKETQNKKIFIEDGRIFISKSQRKYDIIMLDAYKGGFIPFHLCTKQFYEIVNKHLKPDGCVLLNLHGGSKLFKEIYFTLLSVFENIDLYSYPDNSNIMAIVYNGNKKSNVNLRYKSGQLQKRYKFFYDMSELIKLSITPPVIKKQKVLTDDFAPVNFLNAIKENNTNL